MKLKAIQRVVSLCGVQAFRPLHAQQLLLRRRPCWGGAGGASAAAAVSTAACCVWLALSPVLYCALLCQSSPSRNLPLRGQQALCRALG